MANDSGVNQFAGFPTQLPYGEKKREGMLQRLAPLAGSPVPEPRRASQSRAPVAAAPAPAPPAVPAVSQPPAPELYAAIAAIPGASPLVQQVFGGG